MDEDIRYVLLICVTLFLGVTVYWGMTSIFDFLSSYLALTVAATVAALAVGAWSLRRSLLVERRRRELLDSIQAPVFDRYQELRASIEDCDGAKRALLGRYLIPLLTELMEVKLPALIRKRDEYADFLGKSNTGACETEISDLKAKIHFEADGDIERALRRNLELCRATLDSYRKIEKTLTLYDIQIRSIEKHLENLRAKLQILEMDDEIKASTEHILQGIHTDIDDLEHVLLQAEPES